MPLGEPEIQRAEQLPEPVHRRTAASRASQEVLRLQTVMIGQEFQSLHLLRTNPAVPSRHVEHRLVSSAETKPTIDEARIVLEVAPEDPTGQRQHQTQTTIRRVKIQHTLITATGLQSAGHKPLVLISREPPAAGVESSPVPAIVRAAPIQRQIHQVELDVAGNRPPGHCPRPEVQRNAVLKESNPRPHGDRPRTQPVHQVLQTAQTVAMLGQHRY